MKRKHTIRPDFVIDNIRDLQEDPLVVNNTPAGNVGGTGSKVTFTVNVTDISQLATNQHLTINNVRTSAGTGTVEYRINDSANMSATDGTGPSSGIVTVCTSDATNSTHLATVLTTAINGGASESDHTISATRDGATITITKTGPIGTAGHEIITSNIHGMPTIAFSGGINPSGYTPLRMTIPGLSSLRTNPVAN